MLQKRFLLWSSGRLHEVPFCPIEVGRDTPNSAEFEHPSKQIAGGSEETYVEIFFNVIDLIINIEFITKFYHKLKDKACVIKAINIIQNVRII